MGIEVQCVAAPGSEEWRNLITGSKISAIMGDSRWDTKWTLYQMMTGAVDAEPSKDIFRVGHAAELMLAELWKMENEGWKLSPGEVQYTDKTLPFPNAATLDRRGSRGRARKYIEFKTARRLEEWGDLDGSKMPRDYQRQAIWGQGISGFTEEPAEIMVMGPFFKHFTYKVEFDQDIFDQMCEEADKFYRQVRDRIEPPNEGKPCDYKVVRRMHPSIHEGELAEVNSFLVDLWQTKVQMAKDVQVEADALKTKIMAEMGQAQFGVAGDQRIVRRVASGRGVALKPFEEDAA